MRCVRAHLEALFRYGLRDYGRHISRIFKSRLLYCSAHPDHFDPRIFSICLKASTDEVGRPDVSQRSHLQAAHASYTHAPAYPSVWAHDQMILSLRYDDTVLALLGSQLMLFFRNGENSAFLVKPLEELGYRLGVRGFPEHGEHLGEL